MADRVALNKLTEFANGNAPETRAPVIKNHYLFGSTAAFVERIEQEGVSISQTVAETFFGQGSLNWCITQQEGDATFFAYGVPHGVDKMTPKAAVSTLYVDRYWQDHKQRYGLAGIARGGKEGSRGRQDVVVAAQYIDGVVERANVGVSVADFPDKDDMGQRFGDIYGMVPIPTSYEQPIFHISGFVTQRMVEGTGNTHVLCLDPANARSRGVLRLDVSQAIEDNLRLAHLKVPSVAVINYSSQTDNRFHWSVAIPTTLSGKQ